MCGIAGIIGPLASPEARLDCLRRMANTMVRRGPDTDGCWLSDDEQVGFAFRRLAILDLSPAGNQPMHSPSGRSVIVFNGEIYNFRELRPELESKGHRFRTRSDTEVLLAALEEWGTGALARLNGMFALAWWDRRARTLLLARDHAGIKPLSYSLSPNGRSLAFASRSDALAQVPWEQGALRGDALRLYLRLHHLPAPYAMLKRTFQLAPGHCLTVRADGSTELTRWWRLSDEGEDHLRGDAALDAVRDALDHAVRRQRISDVPLGVFLSGGIDSPLVSAVARAQAGPSLEAFTISNPGWTQDEGADAERYAKSLDVRHVLHAATPEEALAAVNDLREAQYEPFADFSIIPTLMVSKLARSRVTVALSGDGGDELFFGYERPLSLLRDARDFRWPWPVRAALYVAGKHGLARKRSSVIAARTPGHYYFDVNSRLNDATLRRLAPDLPPLPNDFTLYDDGGARTPETLARYSRRVEFEGQLQRGLKKVDMASMHHSLEVRVPLLDRDVLRTALSIPPEEHLRERTRKAVLRNLLGRYVPPAAIPEPKRGFAVPLGAWLRGPLRELVRDTLGSRPRLLEGVFDRRAVEQYVEEHEAERRDNKWGIWSLLALHWWAERLTS